MTRPCTSHSTKQALRALHYHFQADTIFGCGMSSGSEQDTQFSEYMCHTGVLALLLDGGRGDGKLQLIPCVRKAGCFMSLLARSLPQEPVNLSQ